MDRPEKRRRSGRERRPNSRYEQILAPLESSDEPSTTSPARGSHHVSTEAIDVQDLVSDFEGESNVNPDGDDDFEIDAIDDSVSLGDLNSQDEGHNQEAKLGARLVEPSLAKSLPAFDLQVGANAGARKTASGMLEMARRNESGRMLRNHFITSEEDKHTYEQGRDKWRKDVTVPHRHANTAGAGGFQRSFHHTDSMVAAERARGWLWYTEGGIQAFRLGQSMRPFSNAQGPFERIPADVPLAKRVVLGPLTQQAEFAVPPAKATSVEEAFTNHSESLSAKSSKNKESAYSRRGWIVNVGAKVHCLEWTTNRNAHTQYLAISTLSKDAMAQAQEDLDQGRNIEAPSYTPATCRSSIQLWRVQASKDTNWQGHLNPEVPPFLDMTMFFDWGDPKSIKWCPMPASDAVQSDKAELQLGLLAGIYTDGTLRLVDVRLASEPTGTTRSSYIDRCAFTSQFSETVPTCLAWLSTSSVAVGCANGFVAIWSLESLKAGKSIENARPWFYSQLQSSYILSMTSAYPSRPTIIMTSGMDGHVNITDMRDVRADRYQAFRTRRASSTICWHDISQIILTADEASVLRALPLRAPYGSIEIVCTSSGVSDLAVSPVHGSVLIAQIDGAVVVNSPIERLHSSKANVYRLIWFQHTWRSGQLAAAPPPNGNHEVPIDTGDSNPPNASKATAPSVTPVPSDLQSNTSTSNHGCDDPVVQFLEGRKLEKVMGNTDSHKGASWYMTIHEAQTNITRVAWNSNIEYGGWAAAGTGSGLVRISDLAI